MSGYNAEYTAPQDNEELAELPAETPAPETPALVETYGTWEFPEHCYGSTFVPMTEEQGNTALTKADWDTKKLLATIRHLSWQLRQDIAANDSRLLSIWERAGEIADSRGYCDVFDSIMDELGTGYQREYEYCVTVVETIKYDVHVTGPRNATQSDIEELIGDVDLSDYSELERDWEVDNFETAD